MRTKKWMYRGKAYKMLDDLTRLVHRYGEDIEWYYDHETMSYFLNGK